MTTPIPMTPPNTPAGEPESLAQETRAKVERPHARFDQPTDVVIDPTLSRRLKVRALETLEQDARQLAAASDEGMAGGEATGLHEVLAAKGALDLPPADIAATLVVQNMKSRLPGIEGTEEHATLSRAIDAVSAASAAITRMAKDGPTSAADPNPQTRAQAAAELEVETALAKLDP